MTTEPETLTQNDEDSTVRTDAEESAAKVRRIPLHLSLSAILFGTGCLVYGNWILEWGIEKLIRPECESSY